MSEEIVVLRGEFKKNNDQYVFLKEYMGDKLLLEDKPQIIYETSDLCLDIYLGLHFYDEDVKKNISLRMVRVEKLEQLFSEIAICKEEQYNFNGEFHQTNDKIIIGEDTLYDIIWNQSPLKSSNSGYVYMEIYISEFENN